MRSFASAEEVIACTRSIVSTGKEENSVLILRRPVLSGKKELSTLMVDKLRWVIERIRCAFLGHPWGMCLEGYRCTKCGRVINVED